MISARDTHMTAANSTTVVAISASFVMHSSCSREQSFQLDIQHARLLWHRVRDPGRLLVLVLAWYQTLARRRRLFALNVDLLLFFYRKILHHLGRVNGCL